MASKKTVGLRDLRENTEKYIRKINKGESFTVLRRNKPVFEIKPLNEDDDENWETVIDFTEISKNGVPAEKVYQALKELNEQDKKASR
jgi:antitoxin (DNA-binding transcriptional repressor) of toxin-antitoxin stability system